jgi:hypothetical protein
LKVTSLLEITIDHGHIPFDDNAFVDWLIDAQPGSGAAYYRGHLAHDRCESTRVHSAEKRRRLIAIAKRALAAEQDGLVRLVQRRVAYNDYVYLAVRASQDLPSPVRARRVTVLVG